MRFQNYGRATTPKSSYLDAYYKQQALDQAQRNANTGNLINLGATGISYNNAMNKAVNEDGTIGKTPIADALRNMKETVQDGYNDMFGDGSQDPAPIVDAQGTMPNEAPPLTLSNAATGGPIGAEPTTMAPNGVPISSPQDAGQPLNSDLTDALRGNDFGADLTLDPSMATEGVPEVTTDLPDATADLADIGADASLEAGLETATEGAAEAGLEAADIAGYANLAKGAASGDPGELMKAALQNYLTTLGPAGIGLSLASKFLG